MRGHRVPNESEILPMGFRIDEHRGRCQPFTVWVPGSHNYDIRKPLYVWQFAESRGAALRYLEKHVVPVVEERVSNG